MRDDGLDLVKSDCGSHVRGDSLDPVRGDGEGVEMWVSSMQSGWVWRA